MDPTLSLIVATRGRVDPLRSLFESLEAQSCRSFEVVIVDQNSDGKMVLPADGKWSFPIKYLQTPDEVGLSRARNSGLPLASGRVVLFPDDDCWYPIDFLSNALARMTDLDANVLAGRAADKSGRDINGRFERQTTRIDKGNVWTTGIEWVVFFDRAVLFAVGGYDVEIGVGANTPWQACEGQDIMLRALALGYSCWFDPSVYGHHAELDIVDPAMVAKGRGYARGLGYVLRLHGYSRIDAGKWLLRPCIRASISLIKGQPRQFQYFASVALGRWEGWRMSIYGAAPEGARASWLESKHPKAANS